MTAERSFGTRARDWAAAHPRLLGASVVVAALALMGTAIVVAATLFSRVPLAGDTDPTPSSSPTALPSESAGTEASATAAPSASAGSTPVPAPEWPPVGDPAVEGLLPPMWTVAVVNELNIRSGPGTEHPAIGQLNAGDVAKVLEIVDFEWYHVAADGSIGYVNAGPRGDRWLLATKTPWETSFRTLHGIASDGETYLAYGVEFAFDYPPYELHYSPGFALRSDDGSTWTRLQPGFTTAIGHVAVGEQAWVALVSTPLGGGGRVSFSPDGDAWDEPVMLGNGLNLVAHGPAGFVGLGSDGAWTSSDGLAWNGPHATAVGAEVEALESSDAGYVGFSRHSPSMWATTDGIGWTAVEHGGARVSDAELVGDRLHAVLVDDEGASTLRRGTLHADGSVAWDGPATAVEVGAFHVDQITQGAQGLLATGWEEADLVPVVWVSTDGVAWSRLPSGPDALDSVASFEPVWGPAGWVGPGLQRSIDGETWLSPEYTLPYDGPVPPCPPTEKISTITLAYLGRFAERCLGDNSVTIRGWVAALGFGGCCPPIPEPAWLATPWPPAIIASGDVGDAPFTYQLALYVPPDVDGYLFLEPGASVEVVGHFRDPASATCRQRPLPNWPNPMGSHQEWEAQCRERFVVESVIEVEGP